MRTSYLWLTLPFFFPGLVSSKLVNVTIDDAFGDPTNDRQIQYFPSTAWQRGDGCQPCTAKPSPASDAWLGTWHDATFNPNDTATNSALGQIVSASAQFNGTAVYVNCILTRSFTSPDGNSDMTFFIDDDDSSAGVFQQSPNGDTSYRFDVTVFSSINLPLGEHTVRLEVGHAGKKALILLDSIIYTTDDGLGGSDSTSSSSSSSASSVSSSTPTDEPSQQISSGSPGVRSLVRSMVTVSIFLISVVTVTSAVT